jgi:hypothetical protein
MTATQEFVVPRSIPMTLAMVLNPLSLAAGRAGPKGALGPTPLFNFKSPRAQSKDFKTAAASRFPLAHIGGRYRAARQHKQLGYCAIGPRIARRIDPVAATGAAAD